MFQRFIALARNAFLETIRQPVFGVILCVTGLLMVFNVSLAAFTLDDDDKLLLDLGLSTLLTGGLFLSAFSASGILSREIENKTVLTVVSKPVSRPLLLVGKFVGLLVALGLAYYLSVLFFILAVRHGVLEKTSDPWDAPVLTFGFGGAIVSILGAAFCNYFYGKHFATTVLAFLTPVLTFAVLLVAKFDKRWEVIPFASNFVGGQVLIAAFLVMLAVMITAAVAVAASTRFGSVMTLVICTGVLATGIASDYAFGQHQGNSMTARVLYGIVPNIGPFWVIDGLTTGLEETTVPFSYVGLATGYAVLMTIGILSIGIVAFQKREVG